MKQWDDERDTAEEEELEADDPDRPNLEEMTEKERETIRT
jgi:hypothetical protein